MESAERRASAVFTRRYVSSEAKPSQALEVWQFINILLLGLVTGVFLGNVAWTQSFNGFPVGRNLY